MCRFRQYESIKRRPVFPRKPKKTQLASLYLSTARHDIAVRAFQIVKIVGGRVGLRDHAAMELAVQDGFHSDGSAGASGWVG